MIAPNIFRAYDIRGTYPDQLNAEAATLIGKAFGTYLKRNLGIEKPKVCVGRDNRTHGPELHEAFVSALLGTGCDVETLGVTPSPYVYFANTVGGYDGGCNITASHNTKEYNGFKLITQNGHAIFGEEIQVVLRLIEAGDFETGEGTLSEANYEDEYLEKLKSVFNYDHKLKVVVDSGNGVTGEMYPAMIKAMGHEVVELYTELDGTFPNHQADPVVEETTEDLKKKVIEAGADLGLAFDGDGDRVGLINDKGGYMSADYLMMLLAEDALSRNPGGAIVGTVSNAQTLFDFVKEKGGDPRMCPVGHSFVENTMHETGAIFGGEQSGHFFLPEGFYSYDDALVAALRLIKIVADSDQKASEIFDAYPKTFALPEMRPYCPDEKKKEIIEKVTEHFSGKYPSETMDGIRMDFGNGGWAGVRYSNTSPCLSIIVQAQSEEHLKEIETEVLEHMKTYPDIDFNRH